MRPQDELKRLAQVHRNVDELNSILSIRYLNSILEEMGQPKQLEAQSNERWFYYHVSMKMRDFTGEQRKYILELLPLTSEMHV